MRRFLSGESRRGDVGKLDANIYEWRVHKGANHFRVLFFNWAHVAVAVTAFYKNQQKTPPPDLNRANERRKVWLSVRGDSPPGDWTPE